MFTRERQAPLRGGNAQPILVLLICRVRLYRDAIASLLCRHSGIRAVAVNDTDERLVGQLEALAPDVVLLDMTDRGALELAVVMGRSRPGTRILGFAVDELAVQVVACAQAGLCGYVPSEASISDLAMAIRRIASGDTVCSAEMAGLLFRHLGAAVHDNPSVEVDAALTPRQRQILQLIKKGLSNKEIAQQLALGPSTVKNHVHALLGRLNVGHRAEAAARLNQSLQL